MRFKEADIDDAEEFAHEKEINELRAQIQRLQDDKLQLQVRLQKAHYEETYKENERMQI